MVGIGAALRSVIVSAVVVGGHGVTHAEGQPLIIAFYSTSLVSNNSTISSKINNTSTN